MNDLPDLLQFADGQPVRDPTGWPRRRSELLTLIQDIEYGTVPPPLAPTQGEELHRHTVARLADAKHVQYRLTFGDAGAWFLLDLLIPPGKDRLPVILTGDGCWRYVSDAITLEVLRRGNILAQFNRVEIAADDYQVDRTRGLYRLYPGSDFGALAAWAFGYHRCVDFLSTLDRVDPIRIAVVGHSRGGKAALLAGATDERIALTASNGSGCCGAGSFRIQGPKSETLTDILRFPHWFAPRLREFAGRENTLPFDQHALLALLAPRALLNTEALDDLWANPQGTWHTHTAAREVYRFLGAPDKIGISYRHGPHAHTAEDWTTFLDFVDCHFRNQPPARPFNRNPFG